MTRTLLLTVLIGSAVGVAACGGSAPSGTGGPGATDLLNVSYDPTRELYQEFNAAFVADRKSRT